MNKKRTFWQNVVWALATTPIVAIVGLFIIAIIGVLDDAITIIQNAGYWWIILVVAYIGSIVYFVCEKRIKKHFHH